MHAPIRVTLTALIVTVLVAAVAAVGVVSYLNGTRNARELSAQIVEQTLRRIELKTRALLETATAQGRLGRAAIESGQFTGSRALGSTDFPVLSGYLVSTLKTNPELSYYGFALEATGEYSVAERKPDGAIEIREYARDAEGTMRVLFLVEEADQRRLLREEAWTGYDPRTRPFYIPAKQAGRQVWTDTYAFWDTTASIDSDEAREVPGVSCVTPVYTEADGTRTLAGVIDADFDLYVLCDFLAEVREEVPGLAFIVEHRSDGTHRTIAHPDPEQLVRTVREEGRVAHRLVKTIAEVSDGRVAAFMQGVDAATNAEDGVVHPLPLDHEDASYLGGFLTLHGNDMPPWTLCTLLPRDAVLGAMDRNNRYTALIAGLSLLAALGLGILLSAWLARPVHRVAKRSASVGRLELDDTPLSGSVVREVDRLMTATNDMTRGLRSFRKYVPADLVREILASGEQAQLGGHPATLTMFFSDVAGFTSISESLTPAELVPHLGEYLQAMADAIRAERGTLDKYIGDAVQAFWGAPSPHTEPALAACRAALAAQARLGELRTRWAAAGRPLLHARIGLHTGEVLVGNFGSPTRLDYTAVGEEAHRAEHLEALNKELGTEILISAATRRAVEGRVVARVAGEVTLAGGRTEPVYELLSVEDGR